MASGTLSLIRPPRFIFQSFVSPLNFLPDSPTCSDPVLALPTAIFPSISTTVLPRHLLLHPVSCFFFLSLWGGFACQQFQRLTAPSTAAVDLGLALNAGHPVLKKDLFHIAGYPFLTLASTSYSSLDRTQITR